MSIHICLRWVLILIYFINYLRSWTNEKNIVKVYVRDFVLQNLSYIFILEKRNYVYFFKMTCVILSLKLSISTIAETNVAVKSLWNKVSSVLTFIIYIQSTLSIHNDLKLKQKLTLGWILNMNIWILVQVMLCSFKSKLMKNKISCHSCWSVLLSLRIVVKL